MKILITGGSGFIGWNLAKSLRKDHQVVSTFFNHHFMLEGVESEYLDIVDKEPVCSLIKKHNPDVIFHTIAVPSVDLCETNKQAAERVNVEGTINVLDTCKKTRCKIVFISTTHVFDGTQDRYVETDQPNPKNYYTHTKFEAEQFVQQSGIPFLILRTDQPYGWTESWHKENTVTRTLKKLQHGEKVTEISDWYNTPTLIDDFVYATKILVENDKQGIYHVVGHDFTDRFSWAIEVATYFGYDPSLVIPIKSETLHLPARRVCVHASNEKIQQETGVIMKGIREGISYLKTTRILV